MDAWAGYDSWLEAPYTEMDAATETFYDFCEANGLDPDDDLSITVYEDYLNR